MKKRLQAFTLTELLVVVIVLGILAAVAVPKFSRVLETRRTAEAEEMLSAVRMEQEKRCTLGQGYTGDFSKMSTVAYANIGNSQAKTGNYTYTLTATGVSAKRGGENYVLKIPSYKTGEICCEGEGCEALNKSYPSCSAVSMPEVDECAALDVPVSGEGEADACQTNPNDCSCSTFAQENPCLCDESYKEAHMCECSPSTQACCEEGEEWNEQTKQCEQACTPTYEEIGEINLLDAYDDCDGDTINRYVCTGDFSGTCTDAYQSRSAVGGQLPSVGVDTGDEYVAESNPLSTTASSRVETINSGKNFQRVTMKLRKVTCCGDGNGGGQDQTCIQEPNQEVCCTENQVWTGTECRDKTACELDPNSCSCEDYAQEHVCECRPTCEACPDYAEQNQCKCNPSQATCCSAEELAGGMRYDENEKDCVCPEGTKWSGNSCKQIIYCIVSGSYKYSTPEPMGDSTGATTTVGVSWQMTSGYNTQVLTSCSSSKATIYCRPGQPCDCSPGKSYIMDTYNFSCRYNKEGLSYYKAAGFCGRCGEVTDRSQCISWDSLQNTNCFTPGVASSTEPETPNTGFELAH